MDKDYSIIVTCALRYALGRRSYIVGLVADYITRNIDAINYNMIEVMIKDIKECPYYGDTCDKKDWMKLLAVLEKEKEKHDKDI